MGVHPCDAIRGTCNINGIYVGTTPEVQKKETKSLFDDCGIKYAKEPLGGARRREGSGGGQQPRGGARGLRQLVQVARGLEAFPSTAAGPSHPYPAAVSGVARHALTGARSGW